MTDTAYPDLVSTHGRVGKDPITKDANDKQVVTFPLAVPLGFGDGAATQWYDVEVWSDKEPLYSQIVDGIGKGRRVAVIGSPKTREYNGKTYTTLRAFGVWELQDISSAANANDDF